MTLFAHQVPAMGLKVVRPKWFDGTALCIGTMTPDFAYAVSGYLDIDTHDWPGFWAVDVPLAIVLTFVVRYSTAGVAAAHLPDLGGFQLWSWRVLHRRPPAWWRTVACCIIGAFTHVGIDTFTHTRRAGARWLGYDDVVLHLAGRDEPLASVFQLLGHTLGSLVGLWLLFSIGSRRLLQRWYGADAVAHARHFTLTRRARVVFWSCAAAGLAAGVWWGFNGDSVERIQRPLSACLLGVIVAAALPVCRPAAAPVPPPRPISAVGQPR